MKNIKRSLILLLIAAMILSSVSVLQAEAKIIKFTDISTSWAKQNIINAYNKGLMNGISETLFKPLDKVTHYQALVSIARMTKAAEKYDLIALETKYKTDVLDKYKVPDYARKEIAYAIEAGIVTAADVSAFAAQPYINKQVVSYNIAKALGASYNAQNTAVFLGFKDSMFIRQEYKPYIRFLVDLGVLSSVGDFNPTSLITRDVFAKMMDIASDKYNEVKPTTPTVPTTPAPVPTIPAPTTPTPTPAPVPTVPVEPVIQPNYNGVVEQVIIEYGTIVMQVKGANNVTVRKVFKVADDMKCTVDGVESSYYWKIKVGDKAAIYTNKEEKITKLVIDSRVKKVSGTIESLLITDKMELTVKIQNSGSTKYYITNSTKIIKNKSSVKYDALKAGDNIILTVADTEVLEISADSTITTDNGIIESIMYTRTAAPKLTMIGFDGKNKEYFIRKDLDPKNILINDRGSYVYDLRPGMHVKVELENDEIVKLTTIRTETNNKMDGTIKYVNRAFKIVVLSQYDINGKEITREINVEKSEIADVSLNKLPLEGLKEGDRITVFAVEDAGKLNASLIIINN